MSPDQLNEIINEIKTVGFHKYEEALQNEVKFYTFQKISNCSAINSKEYD